MTDKNFQVSVEHRLHVSAPRRRWHRGTQVIIETNGRSEGGLMDFAESPGEPDQHQPGHGDNYVLIVLHPHIAFPFNQM